MKIILFNNNDSFTFNIRQYIAEAGAEVTVVNSSEVTEDTAAGYDGVVFSPGPGLPSDFPVMGRVLHKYGASKKILGICLGLQAIGEFYGGTLYNLNTIYHGEQITVTPSVNDEPLFAEIETPFTAGVYHSWALRPDCVPEELLVTARGPGGVIQALRHRTLNICAVQFHPESILTDSGRKMIKNWLFTC